MPVKGNETYVKGNETYVKGNDYMYVYIYNTRPPPLQLIVHKLNS